MIKIVVLLAALGCMTRVEASCSVLVKKVEREYGIPRHLLYAISLVESGRKVNGKVVACPWTINAEGVPYVFQNKGEAIQKTQELLDAGITSIDVGCMQVNLKYHPHAFKDLEDAFDPAQNIAYAARFLRQKMRQFGDWNQAVAHYHSSVPIYNIPYQKRVLSMQRDLEAPNGIQKGTILPRNSMFFPIPRKSLTALRHKMQQRHGKSKSHPVARPGAIPSSGQHPILGVRKMGAPLLPKPGRVQKGSVRE